MGKVEEDAEREERITMEIVVDAYTPEEQAIGWYYYLEDKLQFPFPAVFIDSASHPERNNTVQVVEMASEDECEQEMFVEIQWEGDTLTVPLIDLEAPEADEGTQQAISDWHYWFNRGYGFDG
jgi:hypothetical protein